MTKAVIVSDGGDSVAVVMISSLNYEVFELDIGFYSVCRSSR